MYLDKSATDYLIKQNPKSLATAAVDDELRNGFVSPQREAKFDRNNRVNANYLGVKVVRAGSRETRSNMNI